MAYTTTQDFCADVRRLAMIPNSATQGNQNADLLRYADQEMEARIYPLILSVNEEYNVQTLDVNTSQNIQGYRMPPRAIAGKLRDIKYLQGGTQLPMPKIEIEQLTAWTLNSYGGAPAGFFLKAGTVNVVPIPPGGNALRFQYFANHGKFSDWAGTSNAAGGIIGIAPTYSTTLVLNDTVSFTAPSFAPTLNALYDVVAQNPPFEHLAISLKCIQVSPPLYQVLNPALGVPGYTPASLSPVISIGDVICPTNSMPLVPLPMDIYQLLMTRVALQAINSLGDTERMQSLEAQYENGKAQMLKLYSPRVDGSPKKMQGLLSRMTNSGVAGFKVW
jgi:hypothetical protein